MLLSLQELGVSGNLESRSKMPIFVTRLRMAFHAIAYKMLIDREVWFVSVFRFESCLRY